MSEHLRTYRPDERGKDGYPFAWHKIDDGPGVKHLVRQEAGERCVRCGHPYAKGAGEWSPCDAQCTHTDPIRHVYEGRVAPCFARTAGEAHAALSGLGLGIVEARWRILTVHHLNGQKHDCRWWNLAALCQRCHLTIQGRVVMERIWPWPHSDWFKPYAAGWYAHAYLGLDLTRAETLARIDELLALELQEETDCRVVSALVVELPGDAT